MNSSERYADDADILLNLENMDIQGDKLDPNVKKTWTDALRSGKYGQVDGYLKCGDNFCCLGVLADTQSETTVVTTDENGYETANFIIEDKQYDSILPRDYRGLSHTTQNIFATLNDDYGLDFGEIADIIEEKL